MPWTWRCGDVIRRLAAFSTLIVATGTALMISRKKLLAHGLLASMSGKENCFDNAAVETVFESLKAERLRRQNWSTRREATAAIFQYINGFYNPRRGHSYLGDISPLAFEARVA